MVVASSPSPSQIRAERENVGWSIELTAHALGVSPRGYRYWERGSRARGGIATTMTATMVGAMVGARKDTKTGTEA